MLFYGSRCGGGSAEIAVRVEEDEGNRGVLNIENWSRWHNIIVWYRHEWVQWLKGAKCVRYCNGVIRERFLS